jgi:spore coat protein A
MAFRVSQPLNGTIPNEHVPTTLRPVTPLIQTGATRGLLLFEGTDQYGRLQSQLGIVDPSRPALDGSLAWDDEITENPQLNDVEVWEIYNSTQDAHPIHLHLVSFQIVSRQRFTATVTPKEMEDDATGGVLSDVELKGQAKSPAANEAGWKDTVIMYPGEVTRIIAKFDRPGEYVWHCHILSHEDHEMMRPYFVGEMPPPGVAGSFSGTSGTATGNNVGFTALSTVVGAPMADVPGKSTFVFSSYDERPPIKRVDMFQLPWWLY